MRDYTYMNLHVVNEGKTENEKIFEGRLPIVGEAWYLLVLEKMDQ